MNKLIWQQDFLQQGADLSEWNIRMGNDLLDDNGNPIDTGWGNGEQQFYTRHTSNLFIDENGLNLCARRDTTTLQDARSFASFNEGPFVSATATALAVAAIDRRVADRQFSTRLLQVPALNAIAVWLHPDDADDAGDDEDDLLIPLAPFPLNVQDGVPIPAPALLSALAELAAVIPEDPDNQQGA